MGFKSFDMYKIFKKYCRQIKYIDIFYIFRLMLGLIFTGSIVIDGLNSGKQIEKLIDKMGRSKGIKNIVDIRKSLVIPSVDLCKGNVICFTSCKITKNLHNTKFINDINIGKAVRASCSYPVIFSPCPYKHIKLIDGGIRENVPWRELKLLGAEKVINVVFESEKNYECNKNLVEVATQSIELLCRELSSYEMEGADYVIKIKSGKVGLLDMKKIDELYELGYRRTKEVLKEKEKIIT